MSDFINTGFNSVVSQAPLSGANLTNSELNALRRAFFSGVAFLMEHMNRPELDDMSDDQLCKDIEAIHSELEDFNAKILSGMT